MQHHLINLVSLTRLHLCLKPQHRQEVVYDGGDDLLQAVVHDTDHRHQLIGEISRRGAAKKPLGELFRGVLRRDHDLVLVDEDIDLQTVCIDTIS